MPTTIEVLWDEWEATHRKSSFNEFLVDRINALEAQELTQAERFGYTEVAKPAPQFTAYPFCGETAHPSGAEVPASKYKKE